MSVDEGGGRQRGRLRRVVAPHLTRQNAVLVVVSAALLVMVLLVQQARPAIEDSSNAFAPSFKVPGEVGKPVDLRLGTVTFSNVRLAKSLVSGDTFDKEDAKPVTTPGIWVVVDFRFVGKRKADSLGVKLVTNDHVSYLASSRAGSEATTSILGKPGIPAKGTVAFEIPKSALAGSSITVGADSPFGDALWDTKAVVELGFDPAKADRQIRQAPQSLTLKRS